MDPAVHPLSQFRRMLEFVTVSTVDKIPYCVTDKGDYQLRFGGTVSPPPGIGLLSKCLWSALRPIVNTLPPWARLN